MGELASPARSDIDNDIAVDIANVSKVYVGASVPALDNVSLSIKRGEFFSLLGPSGCGKTSLLRIIGGFEKLSGGRVLIDGADVGDAPPYARSTNMIFQHLALFPHMNVFENVAFGLRRKKFSETAINEQVARVLALVQLEDYGQRMTHQLSGGQRQRVAMARAMVNQPSVLLLDEPLSALDLQLRIQMQSEIRRLHKSTGRTFIYVTHDQGEAMSMSDRIGVMQSGKIQQLGTPSEIYNRPRTRFVAAFIGHTNLIDGVVLNSTAAGAADVNCGGVTIAATSHTPLAAGQPVTVAFRYERVGIGTKDAPLKFAEAVLTERTYLGQSIRFETRLNNGIGVTAEVPDNLEFSRMAVGDRVSLHVVPSAAVALTE